MAIVLKRPAACAATRALMAAIGEGVSSSRETVVLSRAVFAVSPAEYTSGWCSTRYGWV